MSGRGFSPLLALLCVNYWASVAGQSVAAPTVLLFFPRYTPKPIEIEYKLQPFIPDFIPAVGDIDAFLKVQLLCFPLYVLHTS